MTRGSLSTYTARMSGVISPATSCTYGSRGRPGADVEELPDAVLGGEDPHGSAQEGAVGPGRGDDAGEGGGDRVTGLPVGPGPQQREFIASQPGRRRRLVSVAITV